MPKVSYMSLQPYISHPMRTRLMAWSVEVVEAYKMKPQTLYVAVSINSL